MFVYTFLNMAPLAPQIHLSLHHHSHRNNVTAPTGRPNLRSRLHFSHSRGGGVPRSLRGHVVALGEKKLYLLLQTINNAHAHKNIELCRETCRKVNSLKHHYLLVDNVDNHMTNTYSLHRGMNPVPPAVNGQALLRHLW